MTLKRMQDLDVTGKRVLLRLDLNVPFDEAGQVTEMTRLTRVKPTIDWLRRQGAHVIIMSHLGRPKNKNDVSLSTRHIQASCSLTWECAVDFVEDIIGDAALKKITSMRNGDILLLDNIRFDPREEKNDPAFAKELATLGDIFINDGFSVAHRAHASTEGITHYLPVAAGLSMQAELDALYTAVEQPKKPVVAVVGGSKVSSKLSVLTNLVTRVDSLIIGGGMANTFLLAQGVNVQESLVERDLLDTARYILEKAKESHCAIILPTDVTACASLDMIENIYHGDVNALPTGAKIFDIGVHSIARNTDIIAQASTIVWNGPLGVFEKPPFDTGTDALARAIAAAVKNNHAIAVAGGGDTLAAVEHAGLSDADFTFLSTAGGAFLEWLEGKELPGVKVLMT